MAVKSTNKKSTKKTTSKKGTKASVKKATTKKAAKKSTIKSTSKKSITKKATDRKTEGSAKAPATLGEAIMYPFRRWARCYNFLWALTIIGIVALAGYGLRIVQELRKGNNKELPKFRFGYDFGKGWKVILYAIVLGLVVGVVATIAMMIHVGVYVLLVVVLALIAPMLFIQFAENRSIKEGLDFKSALQMVFNDLGDYIVTYLKYIVQSFVFSMAVVLLFIGIGASQFGRYYLFVDYYNRHKKG